jgi:TolA-binding protein
MRQLVILLLLAATARADVVVTKTVTHTGEILRVTPDGVQMRVKIGDGFGEVTIPKPDIVRVEVPRPAMFDPSVTALKAGRFAEAVTGLKTITDRYAGLNIPWAEEALVKLGEAYTGQKDFTEAKRTLDSFRTLYPKSPLAAGMDVKYARVLLEQGETAKATESLQAFLDPMLKKAVLADDQEFAVAEALVLLGDCQLATGKTDDALDNYLKVVTLFDLDPDRAAEAKYKAAKVFERNGNWKRAKQAYDELLQDAPAITYADDVKKRLADLTRVHPE